MVSVKEMIKNYLAENAIIESTAYLSNKILLFASAIDDYEEKSSKKIISVFKCNNEVNRECGI